MNFLEKFDKALAKFESALLVFSVLFLLFFAFTQVLLRNLFDSGINWADVFNRSMVLWIGFFGAALAASEDKHLSLEILTKFLPAQYKKVTDIFVALFVVSVTCIFAHYSWLFYIDQITFESTDLLFSGFPKAYFTIIFPIGFYLLALHYCIKFLKNLMGFFSSKA